MWRRRSLCCAGKPRNINSYATTLYVNVMPKLPEVKLGAPTGPIYPHLTAPAPGTLLEVVPDVFWLRMPLPFALDHINLWLLADGNAWTIVDCGFGTTQTRELWQAVFAQH